MPEWVVALIGVAIATVGGLMGFVIAQDRRITRLEERVGSLGRQLVSLPKRKSDRVDG